MQISENHHREFFEFILERQRIWHKKEIEKFPMPWTDDPILQKFNFCNCYRELDKGTREIINNICIKELALPEKIFNIIFYRFFNVHYFFTEIIKEPISLSKYRWRDMVDIFDESKKRVRLFKIAYLTAGANSIKFREKEKHVQFSHAMQSSNKIIEYVSDLIKREAGVFEIWKGLQKIKFVGEFLSYQILLDLLYCLELKLYNPDSLVYIGPGAAPSLSRIFINFDYKLPLMPLEQLRLDQRYFLPEREWNAIRYDTPYYRGKYLSLNNIQFCLCEWRKYFNLKNGLKQKRRIYHPREGGHELLRTKS